MRGLVIKAPAKINLTLRVVGKRPDGFHEIDTLMVRLPGLYDEIVVGGEGEFRFSCDDPSVPADESNLVVRAVRLFERETGTMFRRSLHLIKNIPHGAGLGGGSSDAAAMLRLLGEEKEEAWRLQNAATIGSDIPFFLLDGMVRCTGRGEILTPAGEAPVWPVLLLKPSFGVATPDAYKRWQESREIPGIRYDKQEIDGIHLVNDLERPVFAKHRVLAEIKDWLLARNECRAALMCGSGSTLFAVLRDAGEGENLARAAKEEIDPGLWTWVGFTG